MATVNTVLGPVPAESLGITLVHEHLVPGTCEVAHYRKNRPPASPLQILAAELADVRKAGGGTVIDVTGNRQQHYGALPAISRQTGLHIVVSTAFYKEPHLPGFFQIRETDWIADFFVQQIHEGVEGSGIRPGIIGEVGTSMAVMRPAEEKLLRAAARAHRATGLPITTHCTVGTMGLEQLDLFADEGAALDRIVIGHSDLNPDISYHLEIARRGAFIGIDTIGKEHFRYIRFGTLAVPGPTPGGAGRGGLRPAGPPLGTGVPSYIEEEYYRVSDDRRIELILELLHRGLAGQVVLSMDITAHESGYNPETFGRYGYAYLLDRFRARMRERGAAQQELDQMLIHNPARLLGAQEG